MSVCVCRHFRLYLRTNDQLFTDDFSAIVVDEDGQERSYPINRLNYFSGHVVGERHELDASEQIGTRGKQLLIRLLFQEKRTLEFRRTSTRKSSLPTS